MKYIVIKEHRTEFPNPIMLKQGEKVIVGEESEEMPNWIFCKKIDGSNEGWVPKQIIENGIIKEDYNAKELDVDKGTLVERIKELNGWLLLENKSTDEIGWVPIENLKAIEKTKLPIVSIILTVIGIIGNLILYHFLLNVNSFGEFEVFRIAIIYNISHGSSMILIFSGILTAIIALYKQRSIIGLIAGLLPCGYLIILTFLQNIMPIINLL